MKTLLTICSFFVAIASFSQVSAVWTTPTSGTIDGIPFTLTGVTGPTLSNQDFSTADYSAAPLSATQQCISYEGYSPVTITLDSPIYLYVYAKYWRTDTYIFSDNATLLSGSNLTLSNNTIVDAVSYADGIFKVIAPVTTFTYTSSTQTCCSNQDFTFGGTQVSSAGLSNISYSDLKIYPNPATSIVSISTSGEIQEAKLFDLQGREIEISSEDFSMLDVSQIPSGNYFIEVKTNEGILAHIKNYGEYVIFEKKRLLWNKNY